MANEIVTENIEVLNPSYKENPQEDIIVAEESTDLVPTTISGDPIYKTKDGRVFTKTQLLKSGYDDQRITAGVSNKALFQIGDTQDPDQEYKHSNGTIFTNKQLIDAGYTQDRIDAGVADGKLGVIEKKNQVVTAAGQEAKTLTTPDLSVGSNIPEDGASVSTTSITEQPEEVQPVEVPFSKGAGPVEAPKDQQIIETFGTKLTPYGEAITEAEANKPLTPREIISSIKTLNSPSKNYRIERTPYGATKSIPTNFKDISPERERLEKNGIKLDEETKYWIDFPDAYSDDHLNYLFQLKNDNPEKFQRQLAVDKYFYPLKYIIGKLADGGDEAAKTDITFLNKIFQDRINGVDVNADFDTKRNNARELSKLIDKYYINTYVKDIDPNYGDEEYLKKQKEKLKGYIGKDYSNQYGSYFDETIDAPTNTILKTDIERNKKDYGLNSNQYFALKYLEDFNPVAAARYDQIKVPTPPTDYASNLAYQEKSKELEELGISFKLQNLKEQIQDAVDKKNKGTLTSQEYDIAARNIDRFNSLINDLNNLKVKYPSAASYDASSVAMDLTGYTPKAGLNYLGGKLGLGMEGIFQGVYDLANVIDQNLPRNFNDLVAFVNEGRTDWIDQNNVNYSQLATAGSGLVEKGMYYIPQSKRYMPQYAVELKGELKNLAEPILSNKNLSEQQKYEQILPLLTKYPDDYSKVPVKDGNLNINGSSIFYGVSDLVSTLMPFMAVEAFTGGMGGMSQFKSAFSAAMATGMHESYKAAVEQGIRDPYSYALITTAINSASMASAGVPSKIKEMLGTKTVAGQLVNKMDDAAIAAIAKNSKNSSIYKYMSNFGQGVMGGIKGGASFEATQIPAKHLLAGMNDEKRTVEEDIKEAAVGILNFGALGAGVATIKGFAPRETLTGLQAATLLKTVENPEGWIRSAKKQFDNGVISASDFAEIKNNIETAAEVDKTLKYVDNKNNPLSEAKKARLLASKVLIRKLEKEKQGDMPAEVVENIDNEINNVNQQIQITQNSETKDPDEVPIPESAKIKLKAFKLTPEKEEVTETPVQVEAETKVSDLLDQVGSYQNQRGRLFLDGQTVVFKVEGQNKEYEIGNIDEVGQRPIKDFGIEQEVSVVKIDDAGQFEIRGKQYTNPSEQQGGKPTDAILYDENGNVKNVQLTDANGKTVTFRGSVAEDVAYQLHLKEITKDNATTQEFEQHINTPEVKSEIDANTVSAAPAEVTTEITTTVPREKIEPTTTETTTAELTGTKPAETITEKNTAKQVVKLDNGDFIVVYNDGTVTLKEQDGVKIGDYNNIDLALKVAEQYEGRKVNVTETKDLIEGEPVESVTETKTTEQPIETEVSAETKKIEPVVETTPAIDKEEVQRQMKPITDEMVKIEREFKNEGYDIDWNYDNEIQILDKNGEQVLPEDLPSNLVELAAKYENATRSLGDFDQGSFIKSLNESRKVVETEAIEVKPEVITEPISKTAKSKLQEFKITPEIEVETEVEKPSELEKNVSGNVVNFPTAQIKTNVEEYQGRKTLFSERSAQKVAEEYDPNKFDPIVIYKHPDGNVYVLSGHSRFEGMKRRGEPTIPARFFEGTPEAARDFALKSNKLGTLQTDIENAAYYRQQMQSGRSYNSVMTEAKENEQAGSAKKIISYAHLNPEGKAIAALSSLEGTEGDTASNLTTIATKIGDIRAKNEHLTDAHENELFDFMTADKDNIPTDKELQDPNSQINRSIAAVKFKPEEPLNLNRFTNKTPERIEWEREKRDLEDQIRDYRKEVNPSKVTGWTGLKERAIASLATGKSKEAIEEATTKFENDVNGVKTQYEKVLSKKKAELRALEDKLAKHLLREKGLIEGEKSQQSLFSVEKTRTKALATMTEAVGDIISDNPQKSLTEVQADVAKYTGDNSNAMRQLVADAYAEAKNNATAKLVKDPIIRRLNRAFLNMGTTILENGAQLLAKAKQLAGARFNVESETSQFETRNGKPIGFKYDTDLVARERFDLSKLNKLGEGSDRVVFDLGDGKVLKIAKTARGLEQNIHEGDAYLTFLPEVYERGQNYVVVDNTPRLKSSDIVPTYDIETGVENGTTTAGQMLRELGKFTQRDFDRRSSELQDVMAKYGFEDIFSYDVLYRDFAAGRNWGYKDGRPMHLDGGTFGGVRMIDEYRGKKNLSDPDFRRIYEQSRAIKKQYADTDKYTMFHYDANGDILGFTHNGQLYLNGEKLTARTTMEEAGHVWVNHVKENRKDLFDSGLKKVEGSNYLKEVRASEFYKKEALKQGPENSDAYNQYMKEEALAKAIADQGAKFATENQRVSFKEWVKKMWQSVAKHFGIRDLSANEIAKMSLEQFATKAAADVFARAKKEGRTPPKEESPLPKSKGTPVSEITENTFVYSPDKNTRVSGFMSHLMDAENVSQEVKEGFKKNGIRYSVANNAEARVVAKNIVESVGETDALHMANMNDLHPSVRSAIFAELIDAAYLREKNAKTEQERIDAATRWKDISTQYDELLTAGGQFTSYASHFYKTSPLGFIMKVNEMNQEKFNDWYKDKDRSFEDLFNELTSSEEGRAFIDSEFENRFKEAIETEGQKRANEIAENLYKNLPKARKSLADKALDALDKFQKKLRGKYYSDATGMVAIIDAGITIIKAAIKSGVAASRAIELGIEEIKDRYKKAFGKDWDKEDEFRTDMRQEFKDGGVDAKNPTEDIADKNIKRIQKRIDELRDEMRTGKFKQLSEKEKKEITEEEQNLLDELKEVKEQHKKAMMLTPEWQEKQATELLNKYRAKLKGVNDAQKQEIIKRAIKKLVNAGALKYEDFKQIISDVIGIKSISPEKQKEIEQLNETINYVDVAEQKMIDNPTPANIEEFTRARREGLKAQKALSSMVSSGPDTQSLFRSFITGSLMGVSTLIKNVYNNVFLQSTVRFPVLLTRRALEYIPQGLSWIGNKTIGTKIYQPTTDVLLAQRGYGLGAIRGLSQAIFNFKEGTQLRDYFDKSSYTSSISPREAISKLKMWKQGDLFLTKGQVAKLIARATLGWQPHFILKSMSFGDLPQRWAAEGSAALQIATLELKLTDENTIKAFMLSPEKVAKKIFLDRGMSEEQASKSAEEIKNRILTRGSKAVLEEENVLSKGLSAMQAQLKTKKDESLRKKAGKTAISVGITSQLPFIKVPANAYWIMFKTANPLVSLTQSLAQFSESVYYNKKGESAKAKESLENAKDNMALTIVGMGLGVASASLVNAGLVRSENDEDNKMREVSGENVFGKQNQLNIGKLLGGKNYWVDLNWFGPVGALLNVDAQIKDSRIKNEALGNAEEKGSVVDQIFERMGESSSAALNTLILDQSIQVINAIRGSEKPLNTWLTTQFNTATNLLTGATVVAISKSMLPAQPVLKADNMLDQLDNNLKQRQVLYRVFAGMPKSKVSIWGQPMKQDNSFWGVVGNVMGIEKDKANQFGALIYSDFVRTQNPAFFPMPVDNKITVNGKKFELNPQETIQLQTLVGQMRAFLVAPFVYDMSKIGKDFYSDDATVKQILAGRTEQLTYQDKKYSELTDKEKVDALNILYANGLDMAMEQFAALPGNEKYAKGVPDADELAAEKMKEAYNKLFKSELFIESQKMEKNP